jgi:hypothetical protein
MTNLPLSPLSASRSLSLSLSLSAVAALLCVATPAFAQDAATSPPPPSAVASPMQAMAAPKGAEDMTGSVGFGLGVAAGTSLVAPNAAITIKYWMTDRLAVAPAFNFLVLRPSAPDSTTAWNFAPEAVVLFVPFRSTSTRLSLGGGLGIGFGKTPPATTTAVHVYIPIQAGLEHFFTRWFSMGIAARSNLFDYQKGVAISTAITTTSNLAAVGSLFFYTD